MFVWRSLSLYVEGEIKDESVWEREWERIKLWNQQSVWFSWMYLKMNVKGVNELKPNRDVLEGC